MYIWGSLLDTLWVVPHAGVYGMGHRHWWDYSYET